MLEEKSPQSFLAVLKFYAANPEYVLQEIEPKWRAHLGLPPE